MEYLFFWKTEIKYYKYYKIYKMYKICKNEWKIKLFINVEICRKSLEKKNLKFISKIGIKYIIKYYLKNYTKKKN